MKRIVDFGRMRCMSILFLNSNGYLYDFRWKKAKRKRIRFERENKEFLNLINIIPAPDEVMNEYINQTLQKRK